MNKRCIGRESLIRMAGTWLLGAMLLAGCSGASATRSATTASDSAASASTATATTAAKPAEAATVTRVVDGDTIKVRIGSTDATVRLIGIDTPETVDPRRPVQCFGKEASAHTSALLPKGTAVQLVADVESRDKYQRLLRYVYRSSDGLFVNDALVRDGYARVYTYPPNVAHAKEFVAAEREARASQRGLWSAC
ncbi:MAG: thermonuclease family protein [Acidimicrobiia bacterium]